MDYKKLLEKYNLLLSESKRLIEENDRLKKQLGIGSRPKIECRAKNFISRLEPLHIFARCFNNSRKVNTEYGFVRP